MAIQRDGAVWAMLERCGKTPGGALVDPSDKIVALLIGRGLLTVRKSGRVAPTVQGREALKKRNRSKSTQLRKKDRPSSQSLDLRKSGGAVILPFRRRQVV